MAYPLSAAQSLSRADRILSRLAALRGAKEGVAASVRQAVGHGIERNSLALDLLSEPERIAGLSRMDQVLGDNGLELAPGVLGSGANSLVLPVRNARDGTGHVLKVSTFSNPLPQWMRSETIPRGWQGVSGAADAFDLPDIPGVAPYWLKGSESGVAYAVQPRAAVVYRPGDRSLGQTADWWDARAKELKDNLNARGWHWMDHHLGNIGLMPDRTWAAIDGYVRPYQLEGTPRADYIDRQNYPFNSVEDAIRALRYEGPLSATNTR